MTTRIPPTREIFTGTAAAPTAGRGFIPQDNPTDTIDELLNVPEQDPWQNNPNVQRRPRRSPRLPPEINVFTGRIQTSASNPFKNLNNCLNKHKRYETGIRTRISEDKEMSGFVFGYRIEKSTGLGICTVYDIEIAKVSLVTGLVVEIYIPKDTDAPSMRGFPVEISLPVVLNKTRLYLRRLGYSAKRYKNLTVVETELGVAVLEQGETWKVPEYATPFRFKQVEIEEWTQLPLISEEIYKQAESIHADKKYREQRLADSLRNKYANKYYWGTSGTTTATGATTIRHIHPFNTGSVTGGNYFTS